MEEEQLNSDEKGAFINFNLIPNDLKQKVFNGIKNAGINLLKTSKKGLAKITSKTDTDVAQIITDTAFVAGLLSALGVNGQSLGLVGLFAASKYLPKTKFYKNLAIYMQEMDKDQPAFDKKYPNAEDFASDYDRVNAYRLDKEAQKNRIESQKAAAENQRKLKESRMARLRRWTRV